MHNIAIGANVVKFSVYHHQCTYYFHVQIIRIAQIGFVSSLAQVMRSTAKCLTLLRKLEIPASLQATLGEKETFDCRGIFLSQY